VPTKATLSLPLLNWTGEKNIECKAHDPGSWVEIRTGRDHSAITVTGTTDSTLEIILIYDQSNQSRVMRNKNYILKHLPPTPPFFSDLTSLPYSLPPPLQWHRGTGNGGVDVSSSDVVSHFPCSRVETLPWDTALHELLHCGSFPRAAFLH